ncbi:hypothetical protein NDU88_008812 [Pleurodeles waltl]|uniref:Uncharacterized protein n=1 Tax=Pleurodeles waltl TaxID=8319 RepID=A0AAV7QVR0_PLEWA|nr:hypothetical protein NDU88_008812 [Pleurodeles waltl]
MADFHTPDFSRRGLQTIFEHEVEPCSNTYGHDVLISNSGGSHDSEWKGPGSTRNTLRGCALLRSVGRVRKTPELKRR